MGLRRVTRRPSHSLEKRPKRKKNRHNFNGSSRPGIRVADLEGSLDLMKGEEVLLGPAEKLKKIKNGTKKIFNDYEYIFKTNTWSKVLFDDGKFMQFVKKRSTMVTCQ